MTTYSDRPAVRARLVEVLADALPGVQVSYAYPQAATKNEAVWFGPPDGRMETVDFGGPRPGRDDRWTIQAVVACTGFTDEQSADARCQEILTAVTEVLFAGDRLGTDWKHVALYPGELDGPSGGRGNPHEPVFSVAEFTIEIVVPLRGA